MQQRWGAISEPASREAWCVQSADMLSSRIQPLTDAVSHIADRGDGLVQVQDGWKKKFVFATPHHVADATATSGASDAASDDAILTLTLDTLTTET